MADRTNFDKAEHLGYAAGAGVKRVSVFNDGTQVNAATEETLAEVRDEPIKGFRSSDSTAQPLRLDKSTNSIQTIDYPHHEVHAGSFFRAGMNYTLANAQVATFSITTPNTTKWCHITWELNATADGTFTLLEDVTSLDGGASVTPLNHNRNSATVSTMTCKKGMTGSNLITPTGGTTILSAVLGTGKGSIISRGIGQEFILKQNSIYLFSYTNGTSANIVQLVCEWYEHTDIA